MGSRLLVGLTSYSGAHNELVAVGGDAVLAGFLHGGGVGASALRTAVAWGTAAVAHEGTLFAATDPDQTPPVRADFDPTRRLRDVEVVIVGDRPARGPEAG